MKSIRISSADIAHKMMASYKLHKDGFQSIDEHLNYCRAIRTFFGEDMHNEACEFIRANNLKEKYGIKE